MRKLALIINFLIFIGFTCNAQNKITKTEFEHLIDYANCQYLMAFIENHDARKPYYEDTYKKSVKPVIQKSSLDDLNSIPNFEKIKGLFQGNSNNVALQLAEKINERKSKYANSLDIDALLKFLTIENWYNVNLTETTKKIKNDILKKYSSINISVPKIS